MGLFAAAVLGVIQGLTEFLPVSSSAHLILVPWLFDWKPEGIAFDVSLHVGTAVAILAYFWREWLELAREAIGGILTGSPLGNPKRKLMWFVAAGTLPAVIFGLLFEKEIEETLRSPLVTVVTLTVFGLFLYICEQRSRLGRSLDQFNWGDALWIGFSQALALIPGVSRSGITMSAALLRNAGRASAARFSFLLATPVIVGAGMLQAWRLVAVLRTPAVLAAGNPGQGDLSWSVMATGTLFAAITGFFCIRFFLRYLQTRTFVPFVIYRFVLAAVVLAFYLRSR